MTGQNRRQALKIMAAAPLAAGFSWTQEEVEQAHRHVHGSRASGTSTGGEAPLFFTPEEYRTVRLLADMVIPADERSGGAVEAGVPEFIDFMMKDQPQRRTAMQGGLAWIDQECLRRWERPFADCTQEERRALLDDIAFPAKAPDRLSHGVAFFSGFRDLTATGFWTSRMGIEDLRYQGNAFVAEWKGCPEKVLERLEVRYDEE